MTKSGCIFHGMCARKREALGALVGRRKVRHDVGCGVEFVHLWKYSLYISCVPRRCTSLLWLSKFTPESLLLPTFLLFCSAWRFAFFLLCLPSHISRNVFVFSEGVVTCDCEHNFFGTSAERLSSPPLMPLENYFTYIDDSREIITAWLLAQRLIRASFSQPSHFHTKRLKRETPCSSDEPTITVR